MKMHYALKKSHAHQKSVTLDNQNLAKISIGQEPTDSKTIVLINMTEI